MLGGERAAVESIDRDQCAVCPAAKGQGDDQPIARLKPELAGAMLLKAGAVELVGESLGPTGEQGCAGDRILEYEPSADEALGQRTGACGDEQLAVALSAITSACADTSARPRSATSSRIAVRFVSPPIARAISIVAARVFTVPCNSARRCSEPV